MHERGHYSVSCNNFSWRSKFKTKTRAKIQFSLLTFNFLHSPANCFRIS